MAYKIESVDVLDDAGKVVETKPVIPFSQFPEGRRIAIPDPDTGRLVWCIGPDDELDALLAESITVADPLYLKAWKSLKAFFLG